MKKIMLIHSVTMLLLLTGMFGLSMAAMELSKETKVGAEGSLVTPSGAAVLVGSSEMQVVSGPGGSPQLRSRGSSDVDESASALLTVSTPDAVVLDLGVDGEAGGRRLAEAHDIYDLTYCKMETLLKRMPSRDAKFTPYLDVTDAAGNALIEAGEIVGELVGGYGGGGGGGGSRSGRTFIAAVRGANARAVPVPTPVPSVAALVTVVVLDNTIVRRQVHEAPSLLQSPRQLMLLS